MKQEDTKQKILDKALELFSEYGYDSVSVGQIAQAVGIKAPSLYNHFPGKQAIFDAIVESTAARYAEGTDRLSVHVQDARRDVAMTRTPHPTAEAAARQSSGEDISSIAITCGFIERKSIKAASDFGMSDMTSLMGPMSNCGTPRNTAASSPRSSQTATLTPELDITLMHSRRKVVLPPPGGEMMRTLSLAAQSFFNTSPPQFVLCLGILIETELISRRPVSFPPLITPVPHTPMRKPKPQLIKPLDMSCQTA